MAQALTAQEAAARFLRAKVVGTTAVPQLRGPFASQSQDSPELFRDTQASFLDAEPLLSDHEVLAILDQAADLLSRPAASDLAHQTLPGWSELSPLVQALALAVPTPLLLKQQQQQLVAHAWAACQHRAPLTTFNIHQEHTAEWSLRSGHPSDPQPMPQSPAVQIAPTGQPQHAAWILYRQPLAAAPAGEVLEPINSWTTTDTSTHQSPSDALSTTCTWGSDNVLQPPAPLAPRLAPKFLPTTAPKANLSPYPTHTFSPFITHGLDPSLAPVPASSNVTTEARVSRPTALQPCKKGSATTGSARRSLDSCTSTTSSSRPGTHHNNRSPQLSPFSSFSQTPICPPTHEQQDNTSPSSPRLPTMTINHTETTSYSTQVGLTGGNTAHHTPPGATTCPKAGFLWTAQAAATCGCPSMPASDIPSGCGWLAVTESIGAGIMSSRRTTAGGSSGGSGGSGALRRVNSADALDRLPSSGVVVRRRSSMLPQPSMVRHMLEAQGGVDPKDLPFLLPATLLTCHSLNLMQASPNRLCMKVASSTRLAPNSPPQLPQVSGEPPLTQPANQLVDPLASGGGRAVISDGGVVHQVSYHAPPAAEPRSPGLHVPASIATPVRAAGAVYSNGGQAVTAPGPHLRGAAPFGLPMPVGPVIAQRTKSLVPDPKQPSQLNEGPAGGMTTGAEAYPKARGGTALSPAGAAEEEPDEAAGGGDTGHSSDSVRDEIVQGGLAGHLSVSATDKATAAPVHVTDPSRLRDSSAATSTPPRPRTPTPPASPQLTTPKPPTLSVDEMDKDRSASVQVARLGNNGHPTDAAASKHTFCGGALESSPARMQRTCSSGAEGVQNHAHSHASLRSSDSSQQQHRPQPQHHQHQQEAPMAWQDMSCRLLAPSANQAHASWRMHQLAWLPWNPNAGHNEAPTSPQSPPEPQPYGADVHPTPTLQSLTRRNSHLPGPEPRTNHHNHPTNSHHNSTRAPLVISRDAPFYDSAAASTTTRKATASMQAVALPSPPRAVQVPGAGNARALHPDTATAQTSSAAAVRLVDNGISSIPPHNHASARHSPTTAPPPAYTAASDASAGPTVGSTRRAELASPFYDISQQASRPLTSGNAPPPTGIYCAQGIPQHQSGHGHVPFTPGAAFGSPPAMYVHVGMHGMAMMGIHSPPSMLSPASSMGLPSPHGWSYPMPPAAMAAAHGGPPTAPPPHMHMVPQPSMPSPHWHTPHGPPMPGTDGPWHAAAPPTPGHPYYPGAVAIGHPVVPQAAMPGHTGLPPHAYPMHGAQPGPYPYIGPGWAPSDAPPPQHVPWTQLSPAQMMPQPGHPHLHAFPPHAYNMPVPTQPMPASYPPAHAAPQPMLAPGMQYDGAAGVWQAGVPFANAAQNVPHEPMLYMFEQQYSGSLGSPRFQPMAGGMFGQKLGDQQLPQAEVEESEALMAGQEQQQQGKPPGRRRRRGCRGGGRAKAAAQLKLTLQLLQQQQQEMVAQGEGTEGEEDGLEDVDVVLPGDGERETQQPGSDEGGGHHGGARGVLQQGSSGEHTGVTYRGHGGDGDAQSTDVELLSW